ncbi:titin-like isoform X2 [Mastacembelus armatus]|uniref:Zinc finger protein 638-like n=1 Tax=Mastacembelus armatus TaxID=205130 RepID=A0A3Q3M0R5_9TELE|nr:titin-like isoform X2 [Mastacembelus armatus]
MSHNYPFRRPPFGTDLRPEPGPYSSADRCRTSPERDFYRPPPESFSSSYPSSSSSRGSVGTQWSQDGALSILNSCGLEPSDLALLAELPEDVLTVESLPHVLQQIKGKRGTIKPFPPGAPSPSSSTSSSSYPPISARRPPVSTSTGDWDQLHSQLGHYALDHVPPCPLPSEQVQDHWGTTRASSSVRADLLSSSSSSAPSYIVVDFQHRSPSEYGKAGRAAGPVSSQDQLSFSSVGRGKITCPSRFSEPGPADYRSAPPPPHPAEEHHLKPRGGRHESETSSIRSSRRHTAAVSMPSQQEARDFHGTRPTVFPYSCSLCDITVLSERVWIKHINGTHHADGQLSLLQRFPNWDCRLETVSRADSQSDKWKDEEKPARPPQTANQNPKLQPNLKRQKKTSEKGKVVCVKFPAQSVDETYLRKLTEPFGKIVKILMFPSLAFVELGSTDQAKDLVKFHVNYPPTVNGENIEFSISNTFNFLKSSRVVSFTPVPAGEDGQLDLIGVIKRFGPPLYTMFLPSMAFVEMKNAPDAQKLVDYYSSKTLRINNDIIKVSFSGEYKTLMRVASAKRYDEETSAPKRTRSLSRETGDKTTQSKRKRSSSRDREQDRRKEDGKSTRERRTRSRSTEKTSKEKKTRASSRDKSKEKSSKETRTKSNTKSKEKSSKEQKTKSRSRSNSKEKSTRERKTRSTSRDKSSSRSSRQNRSGEKTAESDKSVKPEKSKEPVKPEKSKEPVKPEKTKEPEKSKEPVKPEKSKEPVKPEKSKEPVKPEKSKEPVKPEKSKEPVKPEKSKEPVKPEKSKEPVKPEKSKEPVKPEKSKEPEKPEKSKEPEKTEKVERTEKTVKSEIPVKSDTESKTTAEPAPVRDKPEAAEKAAESSADESDIEGMEVIAEDGENVEDEDLETLDAEGDASVGQNHPAERTDSVEEDKEGKELQEEEECGMKKQEEGSTRGTEETETQLEDEEESDFPVDLENCITLDELVEDQSDSQGEEVGDEPKASSARVVYFRNLPKRFYTDADFVKLVRGCGKAVRYFLIRRKREGFIEMSTSSEALRAVRELTLKSVTFNGSKLIVHISHRYNRLRNGWEVQLNSDEEKRSEHRSRSSSSRRSKTRNESKTSDKDESCRKSEGRKESSEKSPDKDPESRKSPEKDLRSEKSPDKKPGSGKSPDKDLGSGKSPDKDLGSEKSPDKDLGSGKSPDKDLRSEKTPEKDLRSEKSPEKDLRSEKSPEKDLRSEKSPEKDLRSEKSPDKDPRSKKSPDKKPGSGKSPDKDPGSGKSSEKESDNKTSAKKDTKSTKSTGKDPESRKSAEKDPESMMSAEKETSGKNTRDKDLKDINPESTCKSSGSRKSPEQSSDKKTPEEESVSKATLEKTTSDKELVWEGTPEDESVLRKTEEDSTGKQTQDRGLKDLSEEESGARNSPEKEEAAQTNLENNSVCKNPASDKKTPEKDSVSETTSETSPNTAPDNKAVGDGSEDESVARKTEKNSVTELMESFAESSLEHRQLKRKGPPEKDLVPEKTLKKEVNTEKEAMEIETAEMCEQEGSAEETEETSSEAAGKEPQVFSEAAAKGPDQPDSAGDPPQTEEKPGTEDQLLDSEEPLEETVEPEKPTKPVGTEFVRPVVGYFCHLCQLIYADEDEAKGQHCSSLMHYRKYQETTGKDPWTI